MSNIFFCNFSFVSYPILNSFSIEATCVLSDKKFQWRQNIGSNCVANITQSLRFNTPESTLLELPLTSVSGNLFLCGNVRLDNRTLLLQQLNYQSHEKICDERLILEAYDKWDEQCLNYLYGDFTFVIWDNKRQYLFAARDIVGYKTLYYHFKANQHLIFASTPDPILDHPGVNIELNESSLAYHLIYTLSPHEETYYQGIKKLPAAHYMLIDKTQVKIKRYWPLDKLDKIETIHYRNKNEYYEHFETLFEDAVNDRLRSLYPITSQLSGGLDSSAVTAVAAHLLQAKNQSLLALGSIAPPHQTYLTSKNWTADDSEYMEAIAKQYANINLHKVAGIGHSVFHEIDHYHEHSDVPYRNGYNRLWNEQMYQIAAQHNSRVILTGQYGNFTISWPGPPIRNFRMWLSHKKKQVLELRQYFNSDYSWANHSPIAEKFALAQNMHELIQKKPMFSPCNNFIDQFVPGFAIGSALGSYEARYGIESRDPTADRRIIEFCAAIPKEVYYEGNRTRLLVREGMKKYLPKKVLERTTRGTQAADWYVKFEEELPYLKSLLTSLEQSEFNKYFDCTSLNQLMQNWQLPDPDKEAYLPRRLLFDYQLKVIRALTTFLFLQQLKERQQQKAKNAIVEKNEVIESISE